MEACLFATDFSFESSYIHLSLPLAGFALGRRECTGNADGVVMGTGSGKRSCVGAHLEGCQNSGPQGGPPRGRTCRVLPSLGGG
jgi:hypothetical protein